MSELSKPDVSRKKKLAALSIVAVVIAVVAIAYVMTAGGSDSDEDLCSVTLLITHYNPSYADPVRVAVYIDSGYVENATIDVGSNYTVVLELAQGDYVMGFDFTIAPSAGPDGVIDAEYSIDIESSSTNEFRWEAGDGFEQVDE